MSLVHIAGLRVFIPQASLTQITNVETLAHAGRATQRLHDAPVQAPATVACILPVRMMLPPANIYGPAVLHRQSRRLPILP